MNTWLLRILFICSFILSALVTAVGLSVAADPAITTSSETATYNERTVKGFDPDSIVCTDSDGNGWVTAEECSWGDTSTPWFAYTAIDTQQGTGVSPGGSGVALGQTATTTVADGPHFTTKFYNAPLAPGTTATEGVTSNPVAGNLREQHNEFGFEVIVDKKTDPLEPYYVKFYIPYTTVDSTQDNTTGEMVGDATGTYSKEITEMDPNNPGVFNRYTITGNFTSNASTNSYGCDLGNPENDCSADEEGQWRADW